MLAGDVIKILPGVVHWHGAAADSAFTHLAVNTNTQKGMVNWMERVTDEEYNKFQKVYNR
jgi:quercetin dioxygenase-like cupin family protein